MSIIFKANSAEKDIINLSDIKNIWIINSEKNFEIHITYCYSKTDTLLNYETREKRDKDFESISKIITKTSTVVKGENMFESLKNYLKKHEETIITIIFIILIDQFIFNGAFRDKIKSIVDGMITSVTKKVTEPMTEKIGEGDGN